MRDDQLTRLFGSLADDSEPNDAFREFLFARLRTEAATAPSHTRRWMVLLAAALLVAAIGVGAALGSGLVRLPWDVTRPSPPALPQPSDLPSSSSEPTLPPATVEILPVHSVGRTLTDLTLRARPGRGGEPVASVAAGEVVYIELAETFGPVEANGEAWYPVAWLAGYEAWPTGTPDAKQGWLPVTRDGFATMTLIEPVCPLRPNVTELASMTGWDRVSCWENADLTVEGGWVAGGAGIVPWGVDPSWLNGRVTAIRDGGEPFTFTLAPGVELPAQLNGGDRLRIVGHHDDPAARSCTMTLEGPLAAEPSHIFCREIFVVTSVEALGGGS